MTKALLLKRDQRGAAAIEFALAFPVLVSFIFGIFQIGLLFEASAGMQHALGEGARFATLYAESTTDHLPADSDIKAVIEDKVFRPAVGTFTVANPSSSAGFKTLSVTYSMPTNFIFFRGPTVTMTRSKKVYVATTATTPPPCSSPSSGGGGGTCTSST
jgi:Flp pilus assembly protein TadG